MTGNIWLIELAVRGGLILFLATLVTAFLRTAAWRHLVWSSALVALIFLPALMGVVPPIAVRLLPAAVDPPMTSASSSAVEPAAVPLAPAPTPDESAQRSGTGASVARGTSATAAGAPAAPPAPAFRTEVMLASLFHVWWIVGAMILIPMVVGRVRLHRLSRRARPVESRAWRTELDAASRLGPSVRLLASDEVDVPVTWGVRRPVILLPAGAERWSASLRRHVLLHELAHVERCDAAIAGLARLACALHWFNPLAWWALRRLVRESELASDDQVLLAGATPSSYAGDLVEFARGLRRPAPRSAAAMARSPLGARVTAILDHGRVRAPLRPLRVALVLTLVALVVLPAVAALRPERRSAPLVAIGPVIETPASRPPEKARRAVEERRARVATVAAVSAEPRLAEASTSSGTAAEIFTPDASSDRASASPASLGLESECGESKGASIHADDHSLLISVKSEHCKLRIESEGEIDYAADDSGVVHLARGARLEIDEKRRGSHRRLIVTRGAGGAPEYRWSLDGDDRPFDAEGRRWLAEVLPEIFRATGLNAEKRVARMLESRGVAGVLAEIDLIRSDYVGRLYLVHLLEQADLGSAELRTWIELAGRRIGSDYELAETLTALPAARLGEPGVGEAFVKAAETIGSDYELRRTLAALLDATTPTRATLDRMLAAALTIGSDYELAELLIRVADVYPPGEFLPPSYHRAADTIGSDYELRRALSKALERPLAPGVLVELLRTARSIGSDYELAELLVAVGRTQRLDGAAREAFLEALQTVGSDYEHERASKALERQRS